MVAVVFVHNLVVGMAVESVVGMGMELKGAVVADQVVVAMVLDHLDIVVVADRPAGIVAMPFQ